MHHGTVSAAAVGGFINNESYKKDIWDSNIQYIFFGIF